MQTKKTYIAIDLKSFYASVECVARGLDPLTTNLLVADVSKTEKTICLAVTPSLKAYGISGRARLFEAIERVKSENATRKAKLRGRDFIGSSYDDNELKKNPFLAIDYIAAPPRMSVYREISTKIVATYLKFVAIEDIYPYSIDEVFIDATQYLDTYKMNAHDFAAMLIKNVLKSFGVTATAGIAENMYLCKVALDISAKHIPADQDGVRIAELDTMSYRRTLWTHRNLTDFWMVGNATAKKLNELGLFTMGDVARCSTRNEEILYKAFGKNAVFLIDQAWGYEPVDIASIKAYKPESTSTSAGQVLSRPYTFDETRIIVTEMVDKLVLELVEKNLRTDQIVLTVGYDIENLTDGWRKSEYKGEITTDRYGRRIPKHARGTANMGKYTSSSKLITEKTLELFDRIADKKLLTRRLNITANRLLTEEEARANAPMKQLSLFDDPQEIAQKDADEEREERRQKAVLAIKNRFGSNAIMKGTSYQDAATGIERNKTVGGHHE
ncbi:MAG: DNA methylase [Ruminococcaceae bacterium]|nr:DNA methylase [Oscillospiraceae bacterium]